MLDIFTLIVAIVLAFFVGYLLVRNRHYKRHIVLLKDMSTVQAYEALEEGLEEIEESYEMDLMTLREHVDVYKRSAISAVEDVIILLRENVSKEEVEEIREHYFDR